eukprot:gene23786-30055_t
MKKNNGNEDQAALHKILLAAQPSLLSKCINIQGFSWEPRLDNFYIDTITYVTDLLSTVVISDKCKSSLLGFLKANEIALDEPINNETEAMVMEDNFDFNFGEESEVDFQVNEQTMEIYISLLPSILAQSSGDLLRMLDDFVQWPAELTVLAAATLGGFCKWFGSPDDNVKQLTQLIVSDSWACSLKRSHLAKLVLICVASVDDNVANKAISLLKSVLLTSGMFDGHGVVDSELYCELQGWCDLLLRYGRDEDLGDAMLLITSVMQISFHWNGTLSSSFLSGFQSDSYSLKKINSSETSDVLLPFSPMMYCCVSWIGNNFVVFESEMPNYIRSYMESITVGENKVKSLEDCE